MTEHLFRAETDLRSVLLTLGNSGSLRLSLTENKRFNIQLIADTRFIKEVPPHSVYRSGPCTERGQIYDLTAIRVTAFEIKGHGAGRRCQGLAAGAWEQARPCSLIGICRGILVCHYGILIIISRELDSAL